jgi:3-phytase
MFVRTATSLFVLATCLTLTSHSFAQDWAVAEVAPTLQTQALTEDDMDADADDPAIYLASDPAKSMVVTAVKNAGIRVYTLDGTLKQTVGPHPDGGRINNVDLVYGFTMADGSTHDLVVGSDRGLDVIRIWTIDPEAAEPLTEVTAEDAGRAFPMRPAHDGSADVDNPVDDQATIYGLATYVDEAGKAWVVGTQRQEPVVGVFALEAREDGTVAAVFDHSFRVPAEHNGQDLYAESEDDPLMDWSPQFEGTVVDRTTGTVYAGEEDVGIWAVPITGGEPELAYETRGSASSDFNNPDSVISRDLEGLTIYYASSGTRYLLVSSQGGAHGDAPAPDAPYDDSFAVFSIGDELELLGSFRVAASGDMDAVQESDGADVLSTALPGFPNGLFVTQDGYAGDLNGLDGETASTGFKFVDWAAIASSFEPALEVTPEDWSPRD